MSDPKGTARNRAWDNEEKFVLELSRKWNHNINFFEDKVPSPRSQDASFRCHLSFSSVPFSVLGSSGTGCDAVAARGSAIKNFMQRLKTSYIPNEVYSSVRSQGSDGNPYLDDVISVFKHTEAVLSESTWSSLFSNSGYNISPTEKTMAKSALASVRPWVQEFWKQKGLIVGPPTAADPKKAMKRAVEVLIDVVAQQPIPKKIKSDVVLSSTTVQITTENGHQESGSVIQLSSDDSDIDNDIVVLANNRPIACQTDDSDSDRGLSPIRNANISLNTRSTPVPSVSLNESFKNDNGVAKASSSKSSSTVPLMNGNVNYEKLLGVVIHKQAQQWGREISQYRQRHRAKFEIFDEKIVRHYCVNKQSAEVLHLKMQARLHLEQRIQALYPHSAVKMYAVGSTVNGCGSFNSDMDLCLHIAESTPVPSRGFALKTLRSINRTFRYAHDMKPIVSSSNVIQAKVPIIKMEMAGPYQDLEIDMNINNLAGVYNSHLIHYYSSVDERFPTLCLLLKHWAIVNGINDAMNGTFNSYSLILLMCHYLQSAVTPPVLPNLQYIYPERFSEKPPIRELNLYGQLDPPLPDCDRNTQTVGELLIGFFHYYANFPFETEAISIRNGCRFSRKTLPAENMKFRVFVEEPFDGLNTARCVTAPECLRKIQHAFSSASRAFAVHAPDLDNIGVSVPTVQMNSYY